MGGNVQAALKTPPDRARFIKVIGFDLGLSLHEGCLDAPGWGGYERVLFPESFHLIGKENTQKLERTNGIIRQQIGRWHRKQNKFAKIREQTEQTLRLTIAYFNWIWINTRTKNTAHALSWIIICFLDLG